MDGRSHRRPSDREVGVYDFAAYRVVSDGYFETIGMPISCGPHFRPPTTRTPHS